jgi:hypothetical protein
MWINLPKEDLDLLWSLLTTSADAERKDAALFWRREDGELSKRLNLRADKYVNIANTIQKAQAVDPSDAAYRAAAQAQADDELEVDEDAIVSVGSDPGAFVQAWIWISNEEAGIKDDDEDTCRTCGEEYPEGGDGFDGECPNCADKTDQKLHPENYED